MNIKHVVTIIVLTGSIGLIGPGAHAQPPHTVNCDRGDSLNEAVNRQVGHAGPITIIVSGTCTENVFIARDDVEITGNETSTINGQITVDGARRLRITGLTLTGAGLGIDVFGGDVELYDVAITGNQGLAGVASNSNGYVGIFDSTITNNSVRGVLALQGSSVLVRNTNVSNNNLVGIDATNGATITVENSTISGNDRGILAYVNSNVIIKDSNINNNTGVGIIAESGGTVLIQEGTTVTENGDGVQAILHSNATIADSSISNNGVRGVFISLDSGVLAFPNVTINGNGGAGVFCEDIESSFRSLNPIDDTVICTGFDQ